MLEWSGAKQLGGEGLRDRRAGTPGRLWHNSRLGQLEGADHRQAAPATKSRVRGGSPAVAVYVSSVPQCTTILYKSHVKEPRELKSCRIGGMVGSMAINSLFETLWPRNPLFRSRSIDHEAAGAWTTPHDNCICSISSVWVHTVLEKQRPFTGQSTRHARSRSPTKMLESRNSIATPTIRNISQCKTKRDYLRETRAFDFIFHVGYEIH